MVAELGAIAPPSLKDKRLSTLIAISQAAGTPSQSGAGPLLPL
ncbi:MAG: hypothetical protein ACR2FS_05430 [Phormidesmis sp.]